MEYAFQLTPHPNANYRQALVKLGSAEITCMFAALGREVSPQVLSMGGVPFFVVDCPALTGEDLAALSPMSCACLWARREGEALYPLERPTAPYVPVDMAEILKYKGKTNAAFTTLMLNLARAHSAFARQTQPLTVLDPMCGKGTTLYCALSQGMNAVGMDRDRRDLREAMDFVNRYLQMHRFKHSLTQSSRSVLRGAAIPEAVYTLANDRASYQAGDTRTLRFWLGDARQAGQLLRKTPVELLVTDLPYGVQHAPEGGGNPDGRPGRPESFEQLLRRMLPAWREAVRPGGAMALSFNTFTVRRRTLAGWAQEAGWQPLEQPPLNDLAHDVEQAVNRDVLICLRS